MFSLDPAFSYSSLCTKRKGNMVECTDITLGLKINNFFWPALFGCMKLVKPLHVLLFISLLICFMSLNHILRQWYSLRNCLRLVRCTPHELELYYCYSSSNNNAYIVFISCTTRAKFWLFIQLFCLCLQIFRKTSPFLEHLTLQKETPSIHSSLVILY